MRLVLGEGAYKNAGFPLASDRGRVFVKIIVDAIAAYAIIFHYDKFILISNARRKR